MKQLTRNGLMGNGQTIETVGAKRQKHKNRNGSGMKLERS